MHSASSRFGGPSAKCRVKTCRISGEPRRGEQPNIPTVQWE
jgi:hypothetical protein